MLSARARAPRDFRCLDCKIDVGAAHCCMLRHEVWALTGAERRGGFLWLECIEDGIGRPLIADDFMIPPPETQRGGLMVIDRNGPTPLDTRQRELAESRDYVQRTGQAPATTDEQNAAR